MADWIKKLNDILVVNDRQILEHAGSISHQLAVEMAEQQFSSYQEKQREIERESSLKELEEDLKKVERLKKKNK
jgi:hypothetical protein